MMAATRVTFLAGAALLAAVPLYYILVCEAQQRLRKRRRRHQVGKAVAFLDLDGVVNRTKTADQIALLPELVDRLRRILEPASYEQSTQIVLSTFWKPFIDYIAYALDRQGVDGALVVASTPGRSKSKTCIQKSSIRHLLHPEAYDNEALFPNRAAEIRQFLLDHPQVERFVILDDRVDAADGELLPFFIRTDPAVGLTEDDVRRARDLL